MARQDETHSQAQRRFRVRSVRRIPELMIRRSFVQVGSPHKINSSNYEVKARYYQGAVRAHLLAKLVVCGTGRGCSRGLLNQDFACSILPNIFATFGANDSEPASAQKTTLVPSAPSLAARRQAANFSGSSG